MVITIIRNPPSWLCTIKLHKRTNSKVLHPNDVLPQLRPPLLDLHP